MDTTKTPSFDMAMFDWHTQETQRIGGIFALTLQPEQISNISDAQIEEVANACYRANTVYGVPMFLRFAHEMNGTNIIL